jgi:hypothetical protein
MARLARWDQADMSPLVGDACLNDAFVDSVVSSSAYFSDIVVETLTAERDEYYRLKNTPREQEDNAFNKKNKEKLDAWINCNRPKFMSNAKKLFVR